MNKKYLLLILFACAIMLIPSCRQPQQHQLPANRPNERRAQEIDMVRINQGMVAQEDSLLRLQVQASGIDFTRTEAGFWYKIEHTTENPRLVKDDIVQIHYRLYLPDGTFLEEQTNFLITVGRKEFIPGMDEALYLMRTGESGLFIFPSNLAFGLRGYENIVPPFTPVMFRITVLNQDS